MKNPHRFLHLTSGLNLSPAFSSRSGNFPFPYIDLFTFIRSEILIDLEYIGHSWHYVVLTMASTVTLMFLLQARIMMNNQRKSLNIALVSEVKTLCLFPLVNILTMGGFTICADIIYNIGIINSLLLSVSMSGLVLGGLSGFAIALVYIKQANVKKNAVLPDVEYTFLLDL
jgi:hypothetical protein